MLDVSQVGDNPAKLQLKASEFFVGLNQLILKRCVSKEEDVSLAQLSRHARYNDPRCVAN